MSTQPRPRTGRLPPAPPHWPRGGAVRKRPLHSSPDWRRQRLLSAQLHLLAQSLGSRQKNIDQLPIQTDHFVIFHICLNINWVIRFSKTCFLVLCVFVFSADLIETDKRNKKKPSMLHPDCTRSWTSHVAWHNCGVSATVNRPSLHCTTIAH